MISKKRPRNKYKGKQKSVKCIHGLLSCKDCSKYKIVMLFKNGCDQFKPLNSEGKRVNPCYYSNLKRENHRTKDMWEQMVPYIFKGKYAPFINKIIMYDNINNTEIYRT